MKSDPLFIASNSFGTKLVVDDPERCLRTLLHEGTRHGIQSTEPGQAREPLGYYHRTGPLGDVFTAADKSDRRVAVIGLGVGAMAAYALPGQHFVFFEIDPLVVRIAQNPNLFDYLRQCRGTYEVVQGDGLESLTRSPARSFDLIVVDAFTSDVIPEHLRSRQACDVYLDKLAPHGLLAFHISTTNVDLEPMLAKLAAESSLACRMRSDPQVSDDELNRRQQSNDWHTTDDVLDRLGAG